MSRGAAAPAEQDAPYPDLSRKTGRAKAPKSSPAGRLTKRVVPKADGRYLIYYEKP